jgi:uncharacterized surface protein with fasciclin (FAS1) repeats
MWYPGIRSTGMAMVAAAAIALAGCGSDGPTEQPQPDIVATAQAAGQFGTLLAALNAAGLTDELATGGPYTVFAPTDAAFAALPPGTVEALLADRAALTQILLYHVVNGEVTAAQAAGLSAAPTLSGESVGIEQVGGSLRVGGATVIQADVRAGNGIIHIIDAVMLP